MIKLRISSLIILMNFIIEAALEAEPVMYISVTQMMIGTNTPGVTESVFKLTPSKTPFAETDGVMPYFTSQFSVIAGEEGGKSVADVFVVIGGDLFHRRDEDPPEVLKEKKHSPTAYMTFENLQIALGEGFIFRVRAVRELINNKDLLLEKLQETRREMDVMKKRSGTNSHDVKGKKGKVVHEEVSRDQPHSGSAMTVAIRGGRGTAGEESLRDEIDDDAKHVVPDLEAANREFKRKFEAEEEHWKDESTVEHRFSDDQILQPYQDGISAIEKLLKKERQRLLELEKDLKRSDEWTAGETTPSTLSPNSLISSCKPMNDLDHAVKEQLEAWLSTKFVASAISQAPTVPAPKVQGPTLRAQGVEAATTQDLTAHSLTVEVPTS